MQRDIFILSNNDWDDYWFQRQQFAVEFAKRGARVFFFNKTLTKMPKLGNIVKGKYRKNSRGYVRNVIPDNITVVTPVWLPPLRILRPINKWLIKRTLKSLKYSSPITLVYTPTYNSMDLLQMVKPRISAYINVHNFEAFDVINDMLISEIEIINKVDFLFADSTFNQKRLRGKLNDLGKPVLMSPPGVDVSSFAKAFRGDEQESPKTIVHYGGIGDQLDIDLYLKLSEHYQVFFIGLPSPELSERIAGKINVLPPVKNSDLGEELKKFDIIALLYNKNDRQCRMPAKFFECCATKKPILVANLSEVDNYRDIVYDVQGSIDNTIAIIRNLGRTETDEIRKKRLKVAESASWTERFSSFSKALGLDVVDYTES